MNDLVVARVEARVLPVNAFCGRCGAVFEWMARTESGKTLYYWCPECDRVKGKK